MNFSLQIQHLLLISILGWAGFLFPSIELSTSSQKEKAIVYQELLVKGRVMDSLGPLQGVTITEKGKSKASISDENGFFEINVSGPNAILVFSFVGYQTEEMALDGKSTVTVTLKITDYKELGEVVVTALGITRPR